MRFKKLLSVALAVSMLGTSSAMLTANVHTDIFFPKIDLMMPTMATTVLIQNKTKNIIQAVGMKFELSAQNSAVLQTVPAECDGELNITIISRINDIKNAPLVIRAFKFLFLVLPETSIPHFFSFNNYIVLLYFTTTI